MFYLLSFRLYVTFAFRSVCYFLYSYFLRSIRFACLFIGVLLIKSTNGIDKHLIKTGQKSQFTKKYDDVDIAIMAMQVPMDTRLDLPTIWAIYPKLSKRHVVEVISFRKNKYQKLREGMAKYAS